jgi:hypothetical protein
MAVRRPRLHPTLTLLIVVALTPLALATLRTPVAQARVGGVRADGTGDYTSIAEGIRKMRALWASNRNDTYTLFVYDAAPNEHYDEDLYKQSPANIPDDDDNDAGVIVAERMLIDFPLSLIGVSGAGSITIRPELEFNQDLEDNEFEVGPLLTIDGSKVTIGRDVVISGLTFTDARGGAQFGSRVCNGAVRIINASPTFANNVIVDNTGADPFTGDEAKGGGLCLHNSNALVVGNTIAHNSGYPEGNSGLARGGGVYIAGGAPVLRNNQIVGNFASYSDDGKGGGIASFDANPVIEGNTIAGNVASRCLRARNDDGGQPCRDVEGQGGGIFVGGGTPVIRFNRIAGNNAGNVRNSGGGGVNLENTTNAVLLGNEIVDNLDGSNGRADEGPDTRSNGVRIVDSANFSLDSNIIARNRFLDSGDNRADSVGVAVSGTSSGRMRHNTIADNGFADGSGRVVGLQVANSARVTLANTIFAGHEVAVLCSGSPCGANVQLSSTLFDRQDRPRASPGGGWFASEGEQFGDPRFVAPADPAANYRIAGDSPARDNAAAADPPVAQDVDRNARAIGRPDLGAHEFPYSFAAALTTADLVGAGAPQAYGVELELRGNLGAPGTVVELALPAGTTAITADGGAVDGTTVRWQLGELAPGLPRLLDVRASAPALPGQRFTAGLRVVSAEGVEARTSAEFRVLEAGEELPRRDRLWLPLLRR